MERLNTIVSQNEQNKIPDNSTYNVYFDDKTGRITISGANPIISISIFNMQGILCEKNENSSEINIGKLLNGVYVISFTDIHGVEYHKKIIKH
jgi:hypothetical protein